MEAWVLGGAAVLAACLGGCGRESEQQEPYVSASAGGGSEGGAGAVEEEPRRLTVLDASPRPAVGALTAVDTAGDRLLVPGDLGDVWALSLSGESAGTWSYDARGGELAAFRDAVYDAPRNRLLSLRTYGSSDYELRELPLDGALQSRHLMGGVAPVGYFQTKKFAIDAEAKRLWTFGDDAVWQLDLEGTGAWTRVAEQVDPRFFLDEYELAILFDAPRERLLLMDGYSRWQLDLASGAWKKLAGIEDWPLIQKRASHFLDADHDRLVFVGGEFAELATLDLATDTTAVIEEAAQGPLLESGVTFDPKRKRIIYFSGADLAVGNAVWERSLDSFELRPLSPNDRLALPTTYGRDLAWDSVRGVVIDTDNGSAKPLAREPALGSSWSELPVSGGSVGRGASTVYDAGGAQLISFGGAGKAAVIRLASDATAWETLPTEDGPGARAFAVSAFDAVERRLLVHGGWNGDERLSDTWLLQVGDEAKWTQLEPTGEPPPERGYFVEGAYDPDGRRMLVVEMTASGAFVPCSVRALSLGGRPPAWSIVATEGEAPYLVAPAVVYDPVGHRLLVASSSLYALELGDTPTWHRFCDARFPTLVNAMALVQDALFLAIDDAAFRFDLTTPYCD